MHITQLNGLGDASAAELRGLINSIDSLLPLLVRIPFSERFRSIVSDDTQIEGELFSAEAFAAIRFGSVNFFPIGRNTIAIDGRKVRAFKPVWDRIVSELSLTGEIRRNPVQEVTSLSLEESIGVLTQVRSNLIDIIPGVSEAPLVAKKGGGIFGWLLVGAAAVYVKTKLA